jgi:hypothetical protein
MKSMAFEELHLPLVPPGYIQGLKRPQVPAFAGLGIAFA